MTIPKVEEKVYCAYVGEHRVRDKEEGRGDPEAAVSASQKRDRYPKWLYYIGKGNRGKGSPGSGLEKFRVGGRASPPYPITGWD